MEPTDNQIEEWRATSRANYSHVAHIPSCADSLSVLDKIFDMALAHNAAKRQEPVAWIVQAKDAPTSPRYLLWEKEGVGMAQQHQCDYTPLYAAPPDLAAKLKEARELLEQVLGNPYAKQGLEQDIKHFLARTK